MYIGINAGAATPMTKFAYDNDAEGGGFLKGFAPKLGVRVGKNFTTVFGVAADADVYFLSDYDEAKGSKTHFGNKTLVNAFNLSLLGTANLSNLFAGYPGEPRKFEVIALGGFGWGHQFGGADRVNALTSKAAIDFAFNLGAEKALQLFIEPAVVYSLQGYNGAYGQNLKYDSRNGDIQVSVGLNYKFANSNGTHNFAVAQLRDQAEIDQLNAKINELRADNSKKDGKIAQDGRTISDLQAKLTACQNQPKATAATAVAKPTEEFLEPQVIFAQGKSTINAAGDAALQQIANYLKANPDQKVLVRGYASPEGNAELNQKLSIARAEAAKAALVKKYKIAADRITAEGLGVSEAAKFNDFNRVAKFIVK